MSYDENRLPVIRPAERFPGFLRWEIEQGVYYYRLADARAIRDRLDAVIREAEDDEARYLAEEMVGKRIQREAMRA